ncbi:GDP-mannose 4,6-dehydratase [Niallia sp. Sow4_A1]|uniref:GDP-mannose 4,6-dehydratase n=1 Tax=Niallia sp. Sow4_A1 TaxID=3438793 RepID=UPI003F996DAE
MRILITGANGFVGRHLQKELIGRNHEVFLGVRNQILSPVHSSLVSFDILNKVQMKKVLLDLKPDSVIHLAAQSSVAFSWKQPIETLQTNIIGTTNLIELLGKYLPETKIITVGSCEEYGLSAKEHDYLDETVNCRPQNPYAISKFAAYEVSQALAKQYAINLIHLRPFNHFGPGQESGFVISDFASKLARIEAGLCENILNVGYLEAERDFTDVRDVVRAYALVAEHELGNGIYNICSGKPKRLKDILEELVELTNLSINVKIDQTKYRIAEVTKIVGDSTKINNALEWKPEIPFKTSLEETLNWWRDSLISVSM